MPVQEQPVRLPAATNRSAFYGLCALIFITTVVMLYLSRLPAEQFADISPFWPVTAMAVVLLWHDKRYVFPLSLGLMVWSHYLQQNPIEVTCLLPLTLIGPFLYLSFAQQATVFTSDQQFVPAIREYVGLLFYAVIPSSFIGSVLYNTSLSGFHFLDIFFVYVLTDFLGVLIFTPLTMLAFNAMWVRPQIHYQLLVSVAMMSALPALVSLYGSTTYTNASIVLLFPLFALSLRTANQSTLILSSFILSLMVTFTVAHGVDISQDNQPIQEFLFVTFWLIAVLIATQVIHKSAQDNLVLLHKAEFQATHNDRTHFPNSRKLEQVFGAASSTFMVMVQVKDRDSLNQSYNSSDLISMEQQTAHWIQRALNGVDVFHVSELRFVVLSEVCIRHRAERLQEVSIYLGESEIYLSLAWGLTSCERFTFDQSVTHASAALSLAMKQAGVRVCGPDDEETIQYQVDKHSHYQSIMSALEKDQILLHYQPILNLELNEVQSAEILARLMIEGEAQSPFRFMSLLMDFDALGKFDQYVIKKAFSVLNEGALSHLQRVNINVTGATLCDEHFMDLLDDILMKTGWPTQDICFEITESDWIRNWDQALRNAQALVDKGFLIAIDDFGAGLASFEYLKRFTMAHIVKLDGAFVQGLAESDQQKAYVAATMEIAQSHHLQVCAEFVDNQATVDYLVQCGVKYAQGYFIGKPSPVQ